MAAAGVDSKGAAGESRRPVDPYGVLVSEIMCQQTRVSAVIPHYLRWMETFPTATALASADDALVRQHWSGLGFYRRAKGLHNSAKEVVERHGGRVPTDRDQLLKLPGVGPYTAGAVASIAGQQSVAAVDGNVIRVFSRLTLTPGRSDDKAVHRACWARAAELHGVTGATNNAADSNPGAVASGPGTPSDGKPLGSPGDLNQAIMELGATVCTPKAPMCPVCPLKPHCAAAAAAGGDIEDLAQQLGWSESQRALLVEAGGGAAFEPALLPCKPGTKLPRVQAVATLPIFGLHGRGKEPVVWLTRRERDGLLSGQWAPPSAVLAEWRPHKGQAPVAIKQGDVSAKSLLARSELRTQLPPCLSEAAEPLGEAALIRDEYKFSGCTHQLHILPVSVAPQAAGPAEAAAAEGDAATGRWFSMSQLRSEAALSTWACRVLGQAMLPRLAAARKSGFFKAPTGDNTAGGEERIHAAFRTLLTGDGAAATNWLVGRGRLAAARDKLLGKPQRTAATKRRAAPKRATGAAATAGSKAKRLKEEQG